MGTRYVRKGYSVRYKNMQYPGGSTIELDEAAAKPFAHQLEADGFVPKEETEKGQRTRADGFGTASGDTQSTDAKRAAYADVHNPDKATYDAEMTAMSQALAQAAHGVKPTGEFPVDPRPAGIIPPQEKGAPLRTNSPDDSPSTHTPDVHQREKKHAVTLDEEDAEARKKKAKK